jgi:hypothetical protein
MRTIPIDRHVTAFIAAIVLLFQMSPALAEGQQDQNRPVEVTFTKWVTTFPLMAGVATGDAAGAFVGEVLQRQVSVNPNLNGIVRLEAIYEVHAGDRSFTALIRGGSNAVTGAAILDGVVLAGWRTGALVHVEFDTIPTGCAGAPPGAACFVGTIQIGRAPKAKH